MGWFGLGLILEPIIAGLVRYRTMVYILIMLSLLLI